ncbi:MAG: M48 family metallopeptidase [Planctomycetes bacterium]|nr:M48 family metallopeptidase [Planctomycetota bacterium]
MPAAAEAAPPHATTKLDFVHPEDRAALEKLQSIPLFPSCVQAFMKLLPERVLHGLNMANKVRLSPRQLPKLYRHLRPICKQLEVAEPEFYLEMHPYPNAYTYGDKTVFVTITSGLVESMDDDEFHAVLAHECGHIACRHVLYHTMARTLITAGSAVFGPLAALSLPVQLGLLYWMRRSELSADRAAAYVMGGDRPVVEVMARLAGGPKSITAQLDLDRYAEQAAAYDRLMESKWDQILQGMVVMSQQHPFLAVRANEIRSWCRSDAFKEMLHNRPGRSSSRRRKLPAPPREL